MDNTIFTEEMKKRRRRALASNVMSETLALEGRVMRTDDDARREEMIYQLLSPQPTSAINSQAEKAATASGAHLPLSPVEQEMPFLLPVKEKPEIPKQDLAEKAVADALNWSKDLK